MNKADKEVDQTIIEVIKVPYGVDLSKALIGKANELGIKQLGLEGDRTPLCFEKELEKEFSVVGYDLGEVAKHIDAPGFISDKEVKSVEEALTGESTHSKIKRIAQKGEGFFLCSLDSISWVTNLRGYHHHYQSTFIAKAIVLEDRVMIFCPDEVTFESCIESDENFTIIHVPWNRFGEKLEEISPKFSLEKLYFDPATTTSADFRILAKAFGHEKLKEKVGGISQLHATKNEVEIDEMEKAFGRSANVIKKIIDHVSAKACDGMTELEFFKAANKFYEDAGAFGLSFKTISGIGANSSIIHFGSPSQDVVISEGDLALLDSGAFYESGLATDCTRAFLPLGEASEKQKLIYTLVLKGLLQAQNAVFPEGSPGCYLDSLARAPIRAYGFDYAHGTGHGIGINVHEVGYRLTPFSQTPLLPGRVGSIEPGIYLPDFGGIRLENVAVVERHPEFEGMCKLRTLIFLGFMPNLIDDSLLNEQEKEWLSVYEAECSKRKTSFRD